MPFRRLSGSISSRTSPAKSDSSVSAESAVKKRQSDRLSIKQESRKRNQKTDDVPVKRLKKEESDEKMSTRRYDKSGTPKRATSSEYATPQKSIDRSTRSNPFSPSPKKPIDRPSRSKPVTPKSTPIDKSKLVTPIDKSSNDRSTRSSSKLATQIESTKRPINKSKVTPKRSTNSVEKSTKRLSARQEERRPKLISDKESDSSDQESGSSDQDSESEKENNTIPKCSKSNISNDVFVKARKALHVSFIPESLPCREEEFALLTEHLYPSITECDGCCLYVSGVPGTGKTATVKEVIRHLKSQTRFKFIEINGMKLTEPTQAYSILWEAVGKEKLTNNHALEKLNKFFTKPSKEPIVVLLDELDVMVTKKQDIMYNFFDWPNRPNASLIVIAIANTMDLPERMLTNRISSRLGMKRINFNTYTYPQLTTIIQSRLADADAIEPSAIELCARKVGSAAGDCRRALDVCRRAVEIAEKEKLKVSMKLMDKVLKEMSFSCHLKLITLLSFQEKLLIVSLLMSARRSGLVANEFGVVAENHFQLCRSFGAECPSWSELMLAASNLNSTNLITFKDNCPEINHSCRLNYQPGEIEMALSGEPFFARILEK